MAEGRDQQHRERKPWPMEREIMMAKEKKKMAKGREH
jgi:hypothetical protein